MSTEKLTKDSQAPNTQHPEEHSEISIEEWTSMLGKTEPMSLSQDDCALILEAIEREPRSIKALRKAFKKTSM